MASLPLIELWKQRKLISSFSILNIKTNYKNTRLGFLWTALEPLFLFILLYVVFTSIRARGEDFAIYLITGIMIYHLFRKGTVDGLNSLISNSGLLKSFKIKKEFFPVSSTTTVGILAFVDLGIFFLLMPVFQFIPGLTIVLLPLVLILLFVLILGLSYILSAITIFVRDVQYIWHIISYALMFASPIFWRLENAQQILLDIQTINPLGQLIELGHVLVINQEIPPLSDWLYTSAIIFSIFFLGFFVFKKLENRIVEML